MLIALHTNHLKAALYSAADKDVRCYLNAVCLRVHAEQGVHYLMSTDGHRAFVGRFEGHCDQEGPFNILIPRETVKAAIRTKAKALELHAMPDGRYMLGDLVFTAIDGKFPDLERVVPRGLETAPATFNPDYLKDARDALNAWSGSKVTAYPLVTHGESPGYMGLADCFVLIMPLREYTVKPPVAPFTVKGA